MAEVAASSSGAAPVSVVDVSDGGRALVSAPRPASPPVAPPLVSSSDSVGSLVGSLSGTLSGIGIDCTVSTAEVV